MTFAPISMQPPRASRHFAVPWQAAFFATPPLLEHKMARTAALADALAVAS